MRLALCCLLLSLTSTLSAQRLRVVPTELPTIQAAIDASAAHDSVLVMPGVYRERLNTDSHHYGGSDVGTPFGELRAREVASHGRRWSVAMTLPPLATVFFEWIP